MEDSLKGADILKRIKEHRLSPEEGLHRILEMRAAREPFSDRHPDVGSSGAEPPKTEESPDGGGQHDIAVVGMACRFPGAGNIRDFWKNLTAGRDSVSEVPRERWHADAFYDPHAAGSSGKTISRWGGFLANIDRFDPLFFNMSPREAELTDPQHRLFLQEAWHAIEDAGYAPRELAGRKCGVFAGYNSVDYRNTFRRAGLPIDNFSFIGNLASLLPARISYFLNLKGPSISINTACSSSLVAIHLACESIQAGTVDMALAGGVQVLTTEEFYLQGTSTGMLSPSGRCRTFDKDADGFVPGEGVGVVVLKSYASAVEDEDHIYAIIKGWGTNQDGKTNGITAPSAPSQTALESEVYDRYGISPESIGYVEAHGTATELGDPIEVHALTDAFRSYTHRRQFCAIGSVKSNIGHTLAAAGIAGFIKTVLCLRQRRLVPSLHYQKANSHIDFENSPFFVNTKLREWINESETPRRAAVSAFGLSGTNAHVILEEYMGSGFRVQGSEFNVETEVRGERLGGRGEPQLIVLSAKSEDRLKAYAKRMVDFIEHGESSIEYRVSSIENIAYTLQIGREPMEHRLAVVVSGVGALGEKLGRFVAGEEGIEDLFAGQVHAQGNRSGIPDLVVGRSGRAFMDTIIEDNEWGKLGQLWVMGSDVDWKRLAEGRHTHRISLPTYPFAKERCWVTSEKNLSENREEAVHPLLGRMDPRQSLSSGLVFRKRMRATDAILRDHVVAEQPILPGVGYLEMAFAAGAAAISADHIKLCNVVWRQPLTVDGNDPEIYFSLRENGNTFSFQVESRTAVDTVIHASGELHPVSPSPESEAPISIREIKDRCSDEIDGNTHYQRFRETGIRYGAYFRGVQHIWKNRKEALGRLLLPKALEGEQRLYTLHPAIADAALQTIFALAYDGAPIPLLPFAVETVEVFRPLPAEAYAHVRSIGENRYQVTVLDADGSICLKCHDLSVRPLPDPLRNFFFIPRWVARKPDQHEMVKTTVVPGGNTSRTSERERILLLYPPNPLGLEKAVAECHRGDDIFRIRLGDKNRQSGRTCEVDVSDPEGIGRCVGKIGRLHRIYFLGGIETGSENFDDPEELEKSQERGVFSLLRLTQALLRHDLLRYPPGLTIVTNDVHPVLPEDRVRPFAGGIHGLSSVIAKEHPELDIARIDFSLRGLSGKIASLQIRNLAASIVRESRNPAPITDVAVRNGTRYLRRIEPISLEPVKETRFRENGVYLIVGGAGGIGLALSRYLATSVGARLVLVGRSPTNDVLERAFADIRTIGGDVHYITADASDEDQMTYVVRETLSRFGTINGVIHSAMLLKDRTVGNLVEKELRAVLSPKGRGSLILYRALRHVPLDFLIFFSSAQSFTCNPGQGSYAAASTLQDALAGFIQQEAPFPVHVINWGYWGSVGIVADDTTQRRMKEQGVRSIEPHEGMEAIRRMLAHRPARLIPLKAEDRFLKTMGIHRKTDAGLRQKATSPSPSTISTGGIQTLFAAKPVAGEPAPISGNRLKEKTLNVLKGIFSTVLKIERDRLDPIATFENYGIDSLVVLEINRHLEKEFGKLRATLLFEQSTLARLTDFFVSNYPKQLKTLFQSKSDPGRVPTIIHTAPPTNDVLREDAGSSVQPQTFKTVPDSRIAVVGMSGRYPMAESLDAFWNNLITARRCIREIPGDRWDWKTHHGPETGIYSCWGGFMDNVDRFDPLFFNISPREAKIMDPQERLFLQTAHAAFEDAGYGRRRLGEQESRVGVFVGVMNCNYEWLGGNAFAKGHPTTAGSAYWSVANRVSYFFDLQGPSLAVDTACSSSLTAIHLACESIRNGDCGMALAGGVNLILHPMHFQRLCQMNMLASDGVCRCFGEEADGFVDGEGVGALVLKPLDRAVADRDHIYGIILASAINAGGKTSGYSVPNPNAQADLIATVLRKAGIDPKTISYVEAHGTGTELGDPIEITGLTQAFQRFSQTQTVGHCAIGSVKSNIGHLESASGIAGITKVLLQMRHGQLAPSLNAETLNPHIRFQETPFYLQRELSAWKRPVIKTADGENIIPRRAGISSFGAGGANAHLIVEEYQESGVRGERSEVRDEPQLIILSAKNEDRLKAYAKALSEFIEHPTSSIPDKAGSPIHSEAYRVSSIQYQASSIENIAYTLQTGRDAMEERLAVVAVDLNDLRDTLFQYVDGKRDIEDLFSGRVGKQGAPSTVLKEGAIDEDFLNRILAERELRKIAMLWVSGYEIDWHGLHPDPPPSRTPLPTYPFAGERYWIPMDTVPVPLISNAMTRPLIDGIDTKMSLNRPGIFFKKRLKRGDGMVFDHQIQERPVLPGSAIVAMVHEAAALALNGIRFRLARGTWLKPLSLAASEAEKEVLVFIRNRGERYLYDVQTRDGDRFVTHATGEIEPVKQGVLIPPVDLKTIKSGCHFHLSQAEVYGRFKTLGLRYGPYFQTVREIWVGEKDALARLGLSQEPADSSLHPALVDGAMQALAGFAFARAQSDPAPLMPFAFDTIHIHSALPNPGYAHVRMIGPQHYDLYILDDTGIVCATLTGVILKAEAGSINTFSFKPVWRPYDFDTVPKIADAPARKRILMVCPAGHPEVADTFSALHERDSVYTLWFDGPARENTDHCRQVDSSDPEAFDTCLKGIGAVDVIYYLGGIPTDAFRGNDFGRLELAQNRLLAFLRLIKALSRLGVVERPIQLNVITGDLQDLPGMPSKEPFVGGLIGFARSLANEYAGLRVRCIDLGTEAISETSDPELLKAWLSPLVGHEIGRGPVNEMALRNGRWYLRRLEPILLSPAQHTPFKQKGVYLILGGSGRIGFALSRYLAESVGARLIWIGRSPWGDALRKKRDLIASLGGAVRYITADAADLKGMKAAVKKAKTLFGSIDGAVHCAVSTDTCCVDDMDEEMFSAALAPKLKGSLVFHQVLSRETLDFLIFFSSSQSFIGDRGLSHYAAGCTFTDAVAGYLNRRVSYPVMSLNWGVWETGSGAETDSLKSRTHALGFRSITPEEGIDALERVLARAVPQVMVLKAADRLLKRIGVDPSHRIERYPETMPTLLPHTLDRIKPPGLTRTKIRRLKTAFGELKQFGRILLLDAFQRMGIFRNSNETYDSADLKDRLNLIPLYNRLLETLIRISGESGFIRRIEETLVPTPLLDDPKIKRATASLLETRDKLAAAHPDVAPHARLLWTCLQSYPEVLTGSVSPVDILFPRSSTELVDDLYKGNAGADYYNRLAAIGVTAFIEDRLASAAPDIPIRILEIGAGTGGTSQAVLEAMAAFKDRVTYDYTDISLRFLQHGRNRFKQYPFIRFKTLDIEKDPVAQGYPPAHFDLIVAANVLHATRCIRQTLSNAKRLLKTNGWLLLNEVTDTFEFATLTFGLMEGWWRYEDDADRLTGGPLISASMWEQVLKEEGFGSVALLGKSQIPVAQHIIIAESNGEVRHPVTPIAHGSAATEAEAESALRKPAEKKDRDQTNIPSKASFVGNRIRGIMAQVLEIDPAEFDPDAPHTDFGVDSILAVEIIDRLSEILAIRLKSTDLFNFPTLRKLVQHIIDSFADQIDPPIACPAALPAGDTDSSDESTSNRESPATGKETDGDEDALLQTIIERLRDGRMDIDEAYGLLNG